MKPNAKEQRGTHNAARSMNKTVNIYILIDALGWEYIKDSSFLKDICAHRQRVKSVLGYSCGVIPSILSGKPPSEHGRFTLFYYNPETSPFRWLKFFNRLPDKMIDNRISRKIVEVLSKSLNGYKGYFETYIVPIKKLCNLDMPERTNIYYENALKNIDTIFDVWKSSGIRYKRYFYTKRDAEMLENANMDLEKGDFTHYFLYLSEFDHFLHQNCKDPGLVKSKLSEYESMIVSLYKKASSLYEEVNICVFSDHGMAPTIKTVDLQSDVDALGFNSPKDYMAIYDSTMARFWFFSDKARTLILEFLSAQDFGRVLTQNELKSLGAYFEDNKFGEVIFLLNPGTIMVPSFMGNKTISGMHGFHPDDKWMDASFLSNFKPAVELKDVRGFFHVMTRDSSCAPRIVNCGKTKKSTSDKTDCAQRKIKVLYFLNSLVRAGVEEHVIQLIERLDKNTFEPILVCPQQLINLLEEDLRRINVKYHPVCIRRWRNIRQISRFLRILRLEKPDIVHSHLFFATFFAAPLSRLSKVPVVIETAHLREAWRKGIKRAFFIDRFFYRFVDKIIAVSNAVKKYLIGEKKINGVKIEVIHNGVDLLKFTPSKTKRNNGHFNIGVIGRLEPQKGHKYFLEAVKLLEIKNKNVNFLIVGDGKLKKELESMCDTFGIEERVKFLGFRTDIKSVIDNLDLVVLPSLYEGLPLVALEAQAMGKAVIATAVDGTSEAVVNETTGLLVPPKDIGALKEAIQIILLDKKRVVEMGIVARKRVELKFDIQKQISQTEKLYKNYFLARRRTKV